ncbi:SRPBCC family protein [Halomarina oriensis]|uniref:SRPBCC family protein n=1 Tax=Halomarina oriensis TaxID=671145 RepID=A0A6B0GGB2_9EURY|nr:SRPBCC family protein [Halomarina oriensis]MWG33976.1 SRPBCC family protein [Halomarina oriensis]
MSLSLSRTADGTRLEIGRVVDAPAETLWNLLRDTTTWPEWGPSVRAVDCDVRYVEAGTEGRVRLATPGHPWARFRITSCADHRWSWSVSPPLNDAIRNVFDPGPTLPATGHRVEPLGEGRCRVVFEVPPLAAGYAVVCRRALARLDELAHERRT